MKRELRKIVMLGFPDAQMLDITGPLEVFSRASRWMIDEGLAKTPAYEIALVAADRGPLTMSSGLKFLVEESIDDVTGPIDTLMVAGGRGVTRAMREKGLLDWLRRTAPRVNRVCSVCTGTFLLAEAGLLDGRSATTHWRGCETLQRSYPNIIVQNDPIFVRDGRVYTSAG